MLRNSSAEEIAALNARFRHQSAPAVLEHALVAPGPARLALVSSFGAEAVVLLHLVSVRHPETPILFVDTELLFTETLVYQQELAERLGLRDLRIVRAAPQALQQTDPDGLLHRRDPDACCALRKSAPLQAALSGFDGWITGRKRHQSGARAKLQHFEREPGSARIKINPLAHWASEDVQTYMVENRLPRHPLVARGYPSIGCQPCTTPVRPDEDARAGRWRRHAKTECGIHFKDGRPIRTGETA